MKTTACGFHSNAGILGRDLLVQYGPTLTVDIGFDPSFDLSSGSPPVLPMQGVHALVDTGATDSCIDSGLAMQLNLPVIDRRTVSGVNGPMEVNMHLAHIHVASLPHTIYGAFAGVNLIAGGQPHSVLIGRTFLRHFYMFYDGHSGQVAIFDEMPTQTPSLPVS